MNGHLRLLNMASAAKAKLRQVVLQKANRDSPLPFSLLGGRERGFGIFIDNVTEDSKATEAGLKRGDQVNWLSQKGIVDEPNSVEPWINLLCEYFARRGLAIRVDRMHFVCR